MRASLLRPFTDLFDLIYPRICPACQEAKPVRTGLFCIGCLAELPETDYHLMADNAFERHFWGRVPVEAGAAFLFFIPGGRTQRLLHAIKYHRQRTAAQEIGRMYGHKLMEGGRFADLDAVIPVPLHWRRRHRRGFNQSRAFASGLAAALGLPVLPHTLSRTRQTSTQTRKTRIERVDNLQSAFSVRRPEQLTGKHLLLVDDVLTTGATLEACAQALLRVPQVRVSMVTIACGRI
ncbi:MAG: phosphoribosyltransferase family protein [Saprospiraceae bacterium]|nr:phosphoribosyltransferase family protein [Saprospiraceae bacterium]